MKSPYHSGSHLSTLPVSIKTCVILLGNIIGIGPICKHLRIFLSLKTVIPDWAQTSPEERRAIVKEAVAGKEGLRLVPSLPIFVPFLLPRVHWGGAMPSELVFTVPPLLSASLVFVEFGVLKGWQRDQLPRRRPLRSRHTVSRTVI